MAVTSEPVPVQSIRSRIMGQVYIYVWIKRERLRRGAEWFKRGTVGLLIFYLTALIAEVVAHVMGRQVPEASIFIQVAFFLLVAILFWLQLTEFSGDRQHLYFSEAASDIVRLVTEENQDFIKKLLAITVEQFRLKGAVNANLALPIPADKLKISPEYCHGQVYDLEMSVGFGGCGRSFAEKQIVCIPWKKHGNAIVQQINAKNPYGMVENCYQPLGKDTGFRSILSVPLLAYGQCYGVLNLDSSKRNAFRPLDFAQAMFYASVMALFLREQQRRSSSP